VTRPKAFGFDVFGTVVDWRSSIARESAVFLARIGRDDLDAERFADAWRARYQPAMAKVRDGGRDFVILDTLHREMLVDLLRHHGVDAGALDSALVTDWSHAWHRLDAWPDSVAGLEWDAILGAEHARAFKPSREVYLSTAAACGVEPGDFCLVAAHHSDLAAARKAGLLTAYIDRPLEYGGAPAPDRDQRQDWDYEADSLTAIAAQLEASE